MKKTYGAARIIRVVCLECAKKLGHDLDDPMNMGAEGIPARRLVGLDLKCSDCKKPLTKKSA